MCTPGFSTRLPVVCPVLHLSGRAGWGPRTPPVGQSAQPAAGSKHSMKTTFMVTARGRALLAHRGPQRLLRHGAGRGRAVQSALRVTCGRGPGCSKKLLGAERGVQDPLSAPSIGKSPSSAICSPSAAQVESRVAQVRGTRSRCSFVCMRTGLAV